MKKEFLMGVYDGSIGFGGLQDVASWEKLFGEY